MLSENSLRSSIPFWLILCVLLSLGSIGILNTAPVFAQAMKPNSERLSKRDEADRQLQLGVEAKNQGQADLAIAHWIDALAIYQSYNETEGMGMAYEYLGQMYVSRQDWHTAEDAFRRRLSVARDRKDLQAQLHALNNLGTVFLKQNDVSPAKEVFTEALAIARSIEDLDGAGLSLSNLGLVSTAQGDYGSAIQALKAAVIFRHRAEDTLGEINTLNNLADAYLNNHQPQDALDNYSIALQLATSSQNEENQFRALEGLTQSHRALGHIDQAFRRLNEWGTMARDRQNLQEQLHANRVAGEIYAQVGDRPQAVTSFKAAIELAKTLEEKELQAFLQQQLSEVSLRLQQSY